MRYGWVITKDDIHTKAVGVSGPIGCTFAKEEIATQGELFRMYDDDHVLYYTGYLLGGTGFEPLDDFGRPCAGCTHIQYINPNTHEWETL